MVKLPMSRRRGTGERVFEVINLTLLVLLVLVTIYPVWYVFIYSLNVGSDSMRGGLFFLPREFTFFNYQLVLGNGVILHAYEVTLIRVVLGTALGLAVTGLTAYALARRNLPGKKGLLVFVLVPMLFSGGIVPYFLVLRDFGLINTIWVYIIPTAFSVWNMFVMRSFFLSIPESLNEAAAIDGAGPVRTLLTIVLPNCGAMVASIGLFTAVWHWNDWFSGMVYVSSLDLIPVQTFLQQLLQATDLSMVTGSNPEAAFRGSQQTQISLMSVKMATVMVSTIPILVVYPFLQKFFVKGVMLGSVKE